MKYPNLAAEMTRSSVKPKDSADCLGIHINGVYLMVRGQREITVDRAFLIRDRFFPDMSIDYLFAEAPEQKPA